MPQLGFWDDPELRSEQELDAPQQGNRCCAPAKDGDISQPPAPQEHAVRVAEKVASSRDGGLSRSLNGLIGFHLLGRSAREHFPQTTYGRDLRNSILILSAGGQRVYDTSLLRRASGIRHRRIRYALGPPRNFDLCSSVLWICLDNLRQRQVGLHFVGSPTLVAIVGREQVILAGLYAWNLKLPSLSPGTRVSVGSPGCFRGISTTNAPLNGRGAVTTPLTLARPRGHDIESHRPLSAIRHPSTCAHSEP